VFDVKWSPHSGKKFATGSKDGTVRIWESSTDKSQAMLKVTPADNQVLSLAWSNKSEHHLAAGTLSGEVFYFDLRNAKVPVATFARQSRTPVFSVQFSPKSSPKELLAIASDDPRLSVVDVNTSTAMQVSPPTEPQTPNLAHTLSLCSYESSGHNDYVRTVAWNASGDTLFSGSWDGTVLAHKLKA